MQRLRLKADGRIVELRDGQEFPLAPAMPDRAAMPTLAARETAPLPAVRDLRRRSQLTQLEFAARLGVPVETIRNWEQGKRAPRGPARALLAVIAHSPETVFARCWPRACRRPDVGATAARMHRWQRRADGAHNGLDPCESHPCSSSKPTAPESRRSGWAPGNCADAPARGWSSRRCGSAIATSTPRRSTRTSARSARACAPPASSATRCSSPRKSGPRHFAPNDLERSAKESLVKLRLTEVDLLLLHWPNPQVPLAETLGALARVKQLGLARHIGVSNFTVALIEEAVAACPEPLVCDQVEYHPYLDQTKVREACARHGMAMVAYSPIAKGRVKNDQALTRIGDRYRKTAAQVCLRWLVQQDVAAIPRTSKLERLSENIEIFDFELSDEDMQQISAMGSAERPAHRFRLRAEMGLSSCVARAAAMLARPMRRGPSNIVSVRWNLRRIIPSDMTASAIAHLSLLALLLLFSEVHPFGAVTAEPIAVDIVAPQDIPEQQPPIEKSRLEAEPDADAAARFLAARQAAAAAAPPPAAAAACRRAAAEAGGARPRRSAGSRSRSRRRTAAQPQPRGAGLQAARA